MARPSTADDVVFTYTTIHQSIDASRRIARSIRPSRRSKRSMRRRSSSPLSAPYAPAAHLSRSRHCAEEAVEFGQRHWPEAGRHRADEARSWARRQRDRARRQSELLGRRAEGPEARRSLSSATTRPARRRLRPGDLDAHPVAAFAAGYRAPCKASAAFGSRHDGGLGVTYLNFNAEDPLLAEPDRCARRSCMLVDQKTIVDDIYQRRRPGRDFGSAAVFLGLFRQHQAAGLQRRRPPSSPVRRPRAGRRTTATAFSRRTARSSTGAHFPPTARTPAASRRVEFMQTMFKQAGIDVAAPHHRLAVLLDQLRAEEQHQVALLGWLNIVDPDRLTVRCSFPPAARPTGASYSNPEVDEPLQKGRTRAEIEARKAAYRSGGDDPGRRPALLHRVLSGLSDVLQQGARRPPGGRARQLPQPVRREIA